MFNKSNIRKRVIKVVEAKIADAQAQYDDEASSIDEHTAESIKVITEQAIVQKEKVEDKLVSAIIGK